MAWMPGMLVRLFAIKCLNLAIAWELILLSSIISVHVLGEAVGTYDLPLNDWLLVLGLAFSVVPVRELTKWLFHRFMTREHVGELQPNA